MEQNLEDTSIEFEFRGIDTLILPSFLKLLDTKDIILDLGNESNINVSYSKKGLKWIKDVKKKDPFWNEEHFIMRVIYSATKIVSENDKIAKQIEENDISNSNPTTDTSISN